MLKDKVSENTKYTVKFTNRGTIWAAIISTIITGIIGIFFNSYQEGKSDNTIERIERNNADLTNQIDNLKESNTKLENQINKLKEANESLKQNNERQYLEEMPKGYFKKTSGVFLLDKHEMVNPEMCDSFENGSCQMKGTIYNNGFYISRSGSVSFYLQKKYKLLKFNFGPVDNHSTSEIGTLRIFADGNQMNKVINHKYEDNCQPYSIEISNVNELKFQWSTGVSTYSYALANIQVFE